MSVRMSTAQSNTIVNNTVVTTAETIIAQVTGLGLTLDGAVVFLFATVNLATGAGTTTLSLRIRRGLTTADPSVAVAITSAASASANATLSISLIDNPGIVSGVNYSFTVTAGGATGNASINVVSLAALVL